MSVDDCPVCTPPPEPGRPDNRPGLPEVDYRLGTFGEFRSRLLRMLSSDPTLSDLSTRETDDHIVTMVEMWSAIASVLCFHTERYANEAWLGTAARFESVTRLVGLIGHEPRPPVAALAWMSVMAKPGASVELPAGQQIGSVPVGTELPQTFETLAPLSVDHRLNSMTAWTVAAGDVRFASGSTDVVLDRATAPASRRRLRAGDRVGLVGTGVDDVETATVGSVEQLGDRVVVRFDGPLVGTAGTGAEMYRIARAAPVFGRSVSPTWTTVAAHTPTTTEPWTNEWTLHTATDATYAVSSSDVVELDGAQDVPVGTRLLVVVPGQAPTVGAVVEANDASSTVGPLTGPVTSVRLDRTLPDRSRDTMTVYVLDGDEIPVAAQLAAPAVPTAVLHVPALRLADREGIAQVRIGATIADGAWDGGAALGVDELALDRALLVVADDDAVDPPDPALGWVDGAATVTGSATVGDAVFLEIPVRWETPPTWAARDVVVLGNVVRASHGETVVETAGDGDASVAFQRVPLRKQPVTHLPPTTSNRPETTLRFFVQDVERTQVPTLYGRPGNERVVATAVRPDGVTEVVGGDDRTAARFPTGVGNLVAVYRFGGGLAGRVPARSLTTLRGAPPDVMSATNPLRAEGGADGESTTELRSNGPAGVRTLGRAVSLRDLEDVALGTGMVTKAVATWVWSGYERLPHLTVAAADGGTLSPTALDDLGSAVDSVRAEGFRLAVDQAIPVPIRVTASLAVDPARLDPDAVVADARARLLHALSFDVVRLAGPVDLSTVVSELAATPGVLGVDVDVLGFVGTPPAAAHRGLRLTSGGAVHPVQPRLRMLSARPEPASPGAVVPAEYATIDPDQHLSITGGLT